MRFYVDALDVELYTPIKFTKFDLKASALIPSCDINALIKREVSLDRIVKPFEKFKIQDKTIPQEWLFYVTKTESLEFTKIRNKAFVKNDLITQYDAEMDKKKICDVIHRIKQCLCIQGRHCFYPGDLLYFTTTITYPTSISRIYLMECIII